MSDTAKPIVQPVQPAPDVAWRCTGHGLKRFMTQNQYDAQEPSVRKWYEPFKCAGCLTIAQPVQPVEVQQAIEAAVLAEREACAEACDSVAADLGVVAAGPFTTDFGKHTHQAMAVGAMNCASAIRTQPMHIDDAHKE